MQEWIDGISHSAIFLGAGEQAQLLGVTRQIIGPAWLYAIGFHYAGSIGPVSLDADLAARWRELFLRHPVLLPFATRLVWAAYDAEGKRIALFRALEDRSLTTVQDDAYELPESCKVGAVHPLELSDDERVEMQRVLQGEMAGSGRLEDRGRQG